MSSQLVPSMCDSLATPIVEGLGDTADNLVEILLDSALDDGLLKGVPVVGTIRSLCKTGANLWERNLIKQLVAFINELNAGVVSPRKIRAHQQKLKDNPKSAERELGRLILILNQTIEKKQSEVLGRLYAAYVSKWITWEVLVELSEANRRMFPGDYDTIRLVNNSSVAHHVSIPFHQAHQLQRLESLGLVVASLTEIEEGDMRILSGSDRMYKLTYLGALFQRYM